MELQFSPKVQVLATEPRAEQTEIDQVRQLYPRLPEEYFALVSKATEIEVQFDNGKYFRLWGPLGCIEMDKGYMISQQIPGAIPIGDDGGSMVIYYYEGNEGWGLYCNSYGNLDPDEAVRISLGLKTLLEHHQGPENFP